MHKLQRWIATLVVASAAAALTGACTTAPAPSAAPPEESERRAPPAVAPQFAELPPSETRSSMQEMAFSMVELNEVLRLGAPFSDTQRSQLVAFLQRLERNAQRVAADGAYVHHPLLHANLDAFVSDVGRARAAIEGEPPNYVPAARVAGACLYCHGMQL